MTARPSPRAPTYARCDNARVDGRILVIAMVATALLLVVVFQLLNELG
ncbi:MAG TPA: hypothetical protein VIH05_04725 [Tepidiformaceae bacterium]